VFHYFQPDKIEEQPNDFKLIQQLHDVPIGLAIDIKRRKNRLLKFCYVPATSTAQNRLLFFFLLLRPFTVLMRQTRQAVRAIKQSIFLDVCGLSQPDI
jgi:hypothetical protein